MKAHTFRIGRPMITPRQFCAPDLRGFVALQQSLRVRAEDRSAWVLMAWANDSKMPYYLTPDGMLWINGLDGKEWFHESFAVFPSQESAKSAGDSKRWSGGWDYLELAQASVSGCDVCLTPVQISDVEANEAMFNSN